MFDSESTPTTYTQFMSLRELGTIRSSSCQISYKLGHGVEVASKEHNLNERTIHSIKSGTPNDTYKYEKRKKKD